MPTTTYTPTATWSNTSSRQANGDVSDEAVLSATGRAALDNIAYLTGSNTRSQVSRIQTCTDLTALKAIGTSDRRDLDFCALDTANGERLYKFDSGSSSTGDDYAVVTPASGSGRWHLVNAKPKTPTLRRVVPGVEFKPAVDYAPTAPAVSFTTMERRVYYPDTLILTAQIDALNADDVISQIEMACDHSAASMTLSAIFYHVRTAAGATAPTVTTLGTLTVAGGTAANTTASCSVTWVAGDYILIKATADASGGSGGTYCGLIFCAVNGTRAYITE